KAEVAGGEVFHFGLGRPGEERANLAKQIQEAHRVRPGRLADRRLVDVDNAFNRFESGQRSKSADVARENSRGCRWGGRRSGYFPSCVPDRDCRPATTAG